MKMSLAKHTRTMVDRENLTDRCNALLQQHDRLGNDSMMCKFLDENWVTLQDKHRKLTGAKHNNDQAHDGTRSMTIVSW